MENKPSGAAHSSTTEVGQSTDFFTQFVGKHSSRDAAGLQEELLRRMSHQQLLGETEALGVVHEWGRKRRKNYRTETPGCAAGETLGLHGIVFKALHDLHHVLTADVLTNTTQT